MRSAVLFLLLSLPIMVHGYVLTYAFANRKCDGWGKSTNLHIESAMFVGVNRTNNRIEISRVLSPQWSQSQELLSGAGHTHTDYLTKNVDWHYILAITFLNPDKSPVGTDHIYYGYDPNKMHKEPWGNDGHAKFYNVSEPFEEHPFRIHWLYLTYSAKSTPMIDIKVDDCNNANPRAWIAQPGIYRTIIPEKKEDFYFENLYYWPRIKQILT